MTNRIWLLSIVLLAGCAGKKDTPKPQIPTGTITSSAVTLDGYPDYIKSWTAQLSEHRTIKVTSTARPWMKDSWDDYALSLEFSDELVQSDGKWVFFDCGNIADKIIDARLVEEIRPYCVLLHKTAVDYWKAHSYIPDSFTDSTGTTWRREG